MLGLLVLVQAVEPEQLHVAFGATETSMVVAWACPGRAANRTVQYRERASPAAKYATAQSAIVGKYVKLHATLHGLTPGATYDYEVACDAAARSQFTARRADAGWSARLALFGDLGWTNNQVLPFLRDESASGAVDAIVLYGDMVYWPNGESENAFMRDLQNLSADGSVPIHVTPGNGDSGGNFSVYKANFWMPGWERSDSLWHSFDLGRAHIVGISTEAFYFQSKQVQQSMMQWLREDLEAATTTSARAARPWIVVHYHRPAYSTNYDAAVGGDKVARETFEPILFHYGVDLIFEGHVHNQERTWPVFNGTVLNGTDRPYHNPRAPVHIVSGNPSSAESTSIFRAPPAAWTAWRSYAFGYARLTVVNTTALYVDVLSTSLGGQVIDDVWLTKDTACTFGATATRAPARGTTEPRSVPVSPRPRRAPAPRDQVAALWQLYQTLGGPRWLRRGGWSQHGDPCNEEWYGVGCAPVTDRVIPGLWDQPGVTALQLGSNRLHGRPSDVDFAPLMRSLQLLDLNDNELDGPLPGVWQGPKLHSLYLDSPGAPFQLHGSLPADVGEQLPNLKHISMVRQRLSGPIPASFGQFACETRFVTPTASACLFWLEDNQLSGPVPMSMCHRTYDEVYFKTNNLTCPHPCLSYSYATMDKCVQPCTPCTQLMV